MVQILISKDSMVISNKIQEICQELNLSRPLIVLDKSHIGDDIINSKFLFVLYQDKVNEDLLTSDYNIVQVIPEVNKNSNVYKNNQELFIDLTDSQEYILNFIQSHGLSKEEASDLALRCNYNLSAVSGALSQLKFSKLPYEEFKNWVFCYVVDNIFTLSNAIIEKNKELALVELKKFKYNNGSVMSLLAVVSNTAKQLMIYKDGDYSKILPDWIKKNIAHMKNYRTQEELEQILHFCNDIDLRIKKGILDAEIALDYVFVRLFE